MQARSFLVTSFIFASVALPARPCVAGITAPDSDDSAALFAELRGVMKSVAASTSVPVDSKHALATRAAVIDQRARELAAVAQAALVAVKAAGREMEGHQAEIERHNAQPHEFELPAQQGACNAYDAEARALDSKSAQLTEKVTAAMQNLESADQSMAEYAASEAVQSLLRDARRIVPKKGLAYDQASDLDKSGLHTEIYDGTRRRDQPTAVVCPPWEATVFGGSGGDTRRPPLAGDGANPLPGPLAPTATHPQRQKSSQRIAPSPVPRLETSESCTSARDHANAKARELERQLDEARRRDPGDLMKQSELKDAAERQRQQADYFEFSRRELERKAGPAKRGQR